MTPESGSARSVAAGLCVAYVAAAVFGAALIVGIHRESPRTAVSAHGLLHSAVAQRFAEELRVPPENPFFAGEPLRYYWFFHAAGAAVGAVTGLDPLRSFELLSVASLWALLAGAGFLARSLYGRPALGLLIAFLVLAGANPQAPLVLGVRWLREGGAVLADDPTYLWGIVHPLVGRMVLWDPYAMYGPLLKFFLNVTARPLALACLVLCLPALHRVLLHGGLGAAAGLTVAVALCASFNLVLGLGAAGALAGAALAVALLARRPLGRRLGLAPIPSPRLAVVALLAGLALGAPTFAFLLGTGGLEVELDPLEIYLRSRTLIASAWLPAALGLLGATRVRGAQRSFVAVLVVGAAVLSAATILVSLPVGNQDSFFHGTLVLLAVPAAGAVLGRDGALRPAACVALVCAFTGTALLIAVAYTGRPAIGIASRGDALQRLPVESDAARLYAWIRGATARDAVFVVDPSPLRVPEVGNTPELPALTERSLFTVRPNHYVVSGYPDLPRRVALAERMLAGEPLEATDVAYLASLGRPLYVVLDEHVTDRSPHRERYGAPVFESGNLAVHRVLTDARPAERRPRSGSE